MTFTMGNDLIKIWQTYLKPQNIDSVYFFYKQPIHYKESYVMNEFMVIINSRSIIVQEAIMNNEIFLRKDNNWCWLFHQSLSNEFLMA